VSAQGNSWLASLGSWCLWDDREIADPLAAVARDAELLEAVRRGAALATARVWENGRCLVVTRAEARLPGFAAAARRLAAEGWPVVARESGGGAVPHAPGILQLSLAFAPPEGPPCTLEGVYRALAAPLARVLETHGVNAEAGCAAGAFCDGRFNLLVGGRKIAGTAQRWRARPGAPMPERGAVLAHALLLVDVDLEAATAAVNRFYALAGGERRFAAVACVSLREARSGGSGSDDLVEQTRRGLLDALRVELGAAIVRPPAGAGESTKGARR
jgi:octanoyl-[GcvH]:protein N-octanoyltransferase